MLLWFFLILFFSLETRFVSFGINEAVFAFSFFSPLASFRRMDTAFYFPTLLLSYSPFHNLDPYGCFEIHWRLM